MIAHLGCPRKRGSFRPRTRDPTVGYPRTDSERLPAGAEVVEPTALEDAVDALSHSPVLEVIDDAAVGERGQETRAHLVVGEVVVALVAVSHA